MRRAIAFCKDIRSSKLISNEFGNVVEEFNEATTVDDDEASGIVNDANDYANETMNDPAYSQRS